MTRVHIAFPIQEYDGMATIETARSLGGLLSAQVSLYVNRPSDQLRTLLDTSGMQWYDLGLSKRANRYIANNTAVAEWEPWGYKSGPNRDFFKILDSCERQGSEWVLLAESDLVPIGNSLNDRTLRLLSRAEDKWVIGASPSVQSKRLLDPRLHDHINGAAFYRVGSPEFSLFRRLVWIPSLISLLKYFPFFAYDCATSTDVWDLLNDHLRMSWQENSDRFVATDLMLNFSNVKLDRASLACLTATTETPIFVHAKIQA